MSEPCTKLSLSTPRAILTHHPPGATRAGLRFGPGHLPRITMSVKNRLAYIRAVGRPPY